MLELFIKALIGYLCGSLVGSLLVGQLRGGVDIREEGSGNPGGSNALRTRGPGFAALVILIDVGKAVLAVLLLPGLVIPGVAPDPAVSREFVAIVAAAATVLGHVFPLFYGFRGGKGVATVLGSYAVLSPGLFGTAIGTWVVVVVVTGYASLASMLAVVVVAVLAVVEKLAPSLQVYAVLMGLFVLFTHRANIRRLRRGQEPRLAIYPGRRRDGAP